METLEIIGYKRDNRSKAEVKQLRAEGNVPCVLYGNEENVHFYSPMILFRDLVYTNKAHFVTLNIEGDIYRCILQDIQFHPVSEIILHADFLALQDDKPVKMDIPVVLKGSAAGTQKGGKLVLKLRNVKVMAKPNNMPASVEADVSSLDLGKSIRVGEIEQKDFEILNNNSVTIATVSIPRAMKGKSADELEEEEVAQEA